MEEPAHYHRAQQRAERRWRRMQKAPERAQGAVRQEEGTGVVGGRPTLDLKIKMGKERLQMCVCMYD